VGHCGTVLKDARLLVFIIKSLSQSLLVKIIIIFIINTCIQR